MIDTLLYSLYILIPILLCAAYLVYFERKIIAFVQLRVGPNVAGPFGLAQPIADAIKLLFKEKIYPKFANRILFIAAPIFAFVFALSGWAVIPIALNYYQLEGSDVFYINYFTISRFNISIIYLFTVSSLEVYAIIIAGWASNSAYSFLGAIRSASQMISYEVSIVITMLIVIAISGSMNIVDIAEKMHSITYYEHLLLIPVALVFFISILAELNRHPFDLVEAESELVAGYNVEYSSMSFALFFLGEYANMILKSSIFTLFFLGGFYPIFDIGVFYFLPPIFWFSIKVLFCLFIFVLIRATYPRYRFDQLIKICWKLFLPINFLFFCVISVLIRFYGFF